MKEADIPFDESERLASLRALQVLDTPREERFDRITRIARALFDVPIALISLVDANRQWFKSADGIAARETPRAFSFCAHAILQDEVFVISDSALDERFDTNPLATNAPYVRFYAGAVIAGRDGHALGTLCLIDRHPRSFDGTQAALLKDLAAWATLELNAVRAS